MAAGWTYFGPDVETDTAGVSEVTSDFHPGTDERRPPSESATGRGVVVGVVDWGFDFAHPDFRNPDGSSRILALWDQRGGKQSVSPSRCVGVHDRAAISSTRDKGSVCAVGLPPCGRGHWRRQPWNARN